MKKFDATRIRELIGTLNQARGLLDELRETPLEEFLADFRNTSSAKYLLVVATESAIDICNHIAARAYRRAPSSYSDCFTVLAEAKVITDDLAKRLMSMAQFRNVLVHLYWEVDDKRVYEILQNNLGDLDEYRDQVVRWMVEKSAEHSG